MWFPGICKEHFAFRLAQLGDALRDLLGQRDVP
jgi:hypothetical protein